MALSSRPATSDDFDFARQAHHLAYRDVVQSQFGAWDEPLQDQFFKTGWEQNSGDGLEILLLDGAPCGYAGVERRADEILLRELVLLPEFQGKGLGTTFLKDLLESAAANGMPVRLQVLKVNQARRLYTRLGFLEIGDTETHVRMQWRHPARD